MAGTARSEEHVRLGRWLRQVRHHHGLTQGEIGTVVGLPQSNISLIEQGRYNISYEDYVRLCQWAEALLADCTDPRCQPPVPLSHLRVASRLLRGVAQALAGEARVVRAAASVVRTRHVALKRRLAEACDRPDVVAG